MTRAYADLAHDYQKLQEEHDRLLEALRAAGDGYERLHAEIAKRNEAIRAFKQEHDEKINQFTNLPCACAVCREHAQVIADANARAHAGTDQRGTGSVGMESQA